MHVVRDNSPLLFRFDQSPGQQECPLRRLHHFGDRVELQAQSVNGLSEGLPQSITPSSAPPANAHGTGPDIPSLRIRASTIPARSAPPGAGSPRQPSLPGQPQFPPARPGRLFLGGPPARSSARPVPPVNRVPRPRAPTRSGECDCCARRRTARPAAERSGQWHSRCFVAEQRPPTTQASALAGRSARPGD